jgi:hypothetical protein
METVDATVMVKCLSVVVTTWTSYALYHTIWVEMFYGIAIDFDLYTTMLLVEISLVGAVLLAVLGQYACMGNKYNVRPYMSLFSTSAAAIVGITTLLVLMYHPGTVHDTLSAQYDADLRLPVADLHLRLQTLNIQNVSHLLFGEELDVSTGVELIAELPHGPLMYIFLSSLFTVAYTAPMILLRCYTSDAHNNCNNGEVDPCGDYNNRHRQSRSVTFCQYWNLFKCMRNFPVWPSIALVQLVIAALVLYSWMSPSLDLMEVVMILAISCGVTVSVIALYTIFTRTRSTGCVCLNGWSQSYDAVEGYYTDAYLHLLVAVVISNVVQAIAAILAYERESHSNQNAVVYTGCVDVLDRPSSLAHESCVVLVSATLALTFRVLLVFYFVAILVLRTVELTQLCRQRRQTGFHTVPLKDNHNTSNTQGSASNSVINGSWDPRYACGLDSDQAMCVCATQGRPFCISMTHVSEMQCNSKSSVR